ncbi:MAG: hypothetical protein ACKOWF_00180, partial [Chloroflexota bacterium]
MKTEVDRVARLFGGGASRRGLIRLSGLALAALGAPGAAAGPDDEGACAGPGKKCGKGTRSRCCGGSRCR